MKGVEYPRIGEPGVNKLALVLHLGDEALYPGDPWASFIGCNDFYARIFPLETTALSFLASYNLHSGRHHL